MSAKKENWVHVAKQVMKSHRYKICTLNSAKNMISSVHPIASVFDRRAYFAAARDSRSSRHKDSDA